MISSTSSRFLTPILRMLLFDVSLHVGPQSESGLAMITTIGPLNSVAPLFLLFHQYSIFDDHFIIGIRI